VRRFPALRRPRHHTAAFSRPMLGESLLRQQTAFPGPPPANRPDAAEDRETCLGATGLDSWMHRLRRGPWKSIRQASGVSAARRGCRPVGAGGGGPADPAGSPALGRPVPLLLQDMPANPAGRISSDARCCSRRLSQAAHTARVCPCAGRSF